MAASQGPGGASFVTSDIIALLTRESDKLAEFRKRVGISTEALTEPGEEWPDEFDYNTLTGTMYTAINMESGLLLQGVQVRCLRSDQLLLIPSALSISLQNPGMSRATHDTDVVDRYRKVMTMTYQQILDLVNQVGTTAAKRAIVDSREIPNPLPQSPGWSGDRFYRLANGEEADPKAVAVVFAVFSRILRLNCDVRDVGFLVSGQPETRVEDNAWQVYTTMSHDRFVPRLQPYTLDSIAALNLAACGNWPIGAWVRALGLGCGLLPSENTKLNKEWKYVKSPARYADLQRIYEAQDSVGAELCRLCLNLIAMFGLLHLNKDNTFMIGDGDMERIGFSYLQALRMTVSPAVFDDIKEHREVALRTAAHPFGLGQSYWVARALGSLDSLATPLAILLDVAPPPTQRLLIVDVAAKEWQALPVGIELNQLYDAHLKAIRAEIVNVRASPPAYSDLWKLYGCDRQKQVSDDAKKAVDVLMPMAYGFAQAMHTDGHQRKDGLALARSFLSVERRAKAVTRIYTNLWNNYLDKVDSRGLKEFVRESLNLGGKGAPSASMQGRSMQRRLRYRARPMGCDGSQKIDQLLSRVGDDDDFM